MSQSEVEFSSQENAGESLQLAAVMARFNT